MEHRIQAAKRFLIGTAKPTCEYVFMLSVILGCNSVFPNVLDSHDPMHYLEAGALVSAALLLLILLWEDKGRRGCIWESCPLLCAELLFGVVFLYFNAGRTGAVLSYTRAFLMFLPLMTLVFRAYRYTGDPFRLLYVLSNTVFLLASLSLTVWLTAVVMGKLQPSGEAAFGWGEIRYAQNYFNICFYWQTERVPLLGQEVMRNTGIFTEAPMYNIFLNSALYTELFLRRRTGWIKCVVFTLTVLSTVGTLGVLFCVFGWIVRLFPAIKGTKVRAFEYVVLVLAAVSGIILVLQKWHAGSDSFATHLDDYIAPLKAWACHPVIGCGYENEAFIQGFMADFRAWNPGLSNSVAPILAEGGVVLFTFCLLPFLLLARGGIKTGWKGATWWAAGMYGIFCTAIFHYRFYLLLLLALGYSFGEISSPDSERSRLGFVYTGMPPQEEKDGCRLLYALTTVLSICILVIAYSPKAWQLLDGLFAKYRFGLEDSQWRSVILVVFLLLCSNAAKYLIETHTKSLS